MARIIGVNSNCYHGYSIEDALEGIAKAGFHYVELTATKGWTEHVFPNQSFERLVEVKNRMKELMPGFPGIYQDDDDDDDDDCCCLLLKVISSHLPFLILLLFLLL